MLFPVFNIAGMMLDNFTSESVPVDMCIDFSGGDGFMSQHALDGPQIGAAFQQMGGEGVAERMGTDILGDAGFFCQLSVVCGLAKTIIIKAKAIILNANGACSK